MKTIINIKTFKSYIDSSSSDELVDACLKIQDEKILSLSFAEQEKTQGEVIDGQGHLLLPGLIDPQVHFREPGGEHKETLETGARSAVRGGFTTVISMPNTSPTADHPDVIKFINDKTEKLAIAQILPTASVSIGLKGEEISPLESLAESGIIAFTDDGMGVQSDDLMKEAMGRIAKLGLPLLDHAEDFDLSKGGSLNDHPRAREHKVSTQDPLAESRHVKRGCELALETGCHYHVLHLSTKESLQALKDAKEKGAPVSAEASPHHLLLSDDDIPYDEQGPNTNFKMNPPLRSEEDRKALLKAVQDGLIDMIATDHAPHSEEEKSKPIEQAPFGIVGLETSFPVLYTDLVLKNQMSLKSLVDLMTLGPKKVFKLDSGTLENGCLANFVLMDLETPREVNVRDFHSKGKNSPFAGRVLKGNAILTYYRGKEVFKRP